MKKLLFALAFVCCFFDVDAQLSFGGNPKLSAGFVPIELEVIKAEMPGLPEMLKSASVDYEYNKNQPFTFAHPFFVDYTTKNSGQWTNMPDGSKVWRLLIESYGAYSINIIFDEFKLAKGCSLFIYNPEQSVVIGAFTHDNNLPWATLATSPVKGDRVIVEYHEPANFNGISLLKIGAINHDYVDIFKVTKAESQRFGKSGDCHPEFSCETYKYWQIAGRSVCRIITDGTELCSGVMLNNVMNDGTPYFLTAAHCLKRADSHQTAIFSFNYEVPNCDSKMEGSFMQTITGAQLRVKAPTLDIALLEMSSIPPVAYRPYWAGWNRTAEPETPLASIHHPEGDVKKIATSNKSPKNASFHSFVSNSHWHVENWTSGTTEAGSSGSALFDSTGLVIGSLSGGQATCLSPINDYFVRLNKAWSHFDETDKQLKAWLDPLNLNSMLINGMDYYDLDCERVSNFTPLDGSVTETFELDFGTWSGHNSRSDKAFAEAFGPLTSVDVYGVYFMPAISNDKSFQTINLKLWQGTDKPQTIIASQDNVTIGQMPGNREFFWKLEQPVRVTGNLWAGVEVNYYSTTDAFALYEAANYATRTENSAWILNSANQWLKLSDVRDMNKFSSFWIDLVVSDTNLSDTIYPVLLSDIVIYPNPVSGRVNFLTPIDKGVALIEVFTNTGQLAQKQKVVVTKGSGFVDVNLPQGVYIIRIAIDNKQYVRKIVVISG